MSVVPAVRSIFVKAYLHSGKPWPEDAYIQVLNLAYFCTANLATLKGHLAAGHQFAVCSRESATFPILWFAWGDSDPTLNIEKRRFLSRADRNQFYFDQHSKKVSHTAPLVGDFARHTQGLEHELIVPGLASLL